MRLFKFFKFVTFILAVNLIQFMRADHHLNESQINATIDKNVSSVLRNDPTGTPKVDDIGSRNGEVINNTNYGKKIDNL